MNICLLLEYNVHSHSEEDAQPGKIHGSSDACGTEGAGWESQREMKLYAGSAEN